MAAPLVIGSFPYRKGGEAELRINPGRITFVLGRKGAGKTSLLERLAAMPGACLIRPASGFGTAGEFLALAKPRHAKWSDADAADAMAEFGLAADSPEDERTRTLLAAVEALACREDFVLMDEPAADMEDRDRKRLYMLMRDLCRGETAFVTAVDDIIDAQIIIDDVIFLENGKAVIAEDKEGLLARAMYVSGHCTAVDVHTDGFEQYGKTSNGKITKVLCMMERGKVVAGSCDVSVQNVGIMTIFDLMCPEK